MKKKWLIALLIPLLFGCEKPLSIAPAIILIESTTIEVLDKVEIQVDEYADRNGKRISPENIKWTIEDLGGNTVKNDFPDSTSIFWAPENSGEYVIRVEVAYENDEISSAFKKVTAFEGIGSFKKKMAGHWKGTGTRIHDNRSWGIDVFIDSTGHYYGTADFHSFDPYCEQGVFNVGRMDYYTNWAQDSCGVPFEVPCAIIELLEVIDNVGSGIIWIPWIQINNGVMEPHHCNDLFVVEDLTLSPDRQELYFEFNLFPEFRYQEWDRKFELTRQ